MTDNKDIDAQTKTPWYEAAKGTAVVGGVFTVIIFGLLVVNYLQIKLLDPMRTERLENLKVKLIDTPENEQLWSRIRELDLRIRKDKIQRPEFSRKGGLLLLGAVVVFLIGIKFAQVCKKKLPCPGAPTDLQLQQIRQAVKMRWVMTAILPLLAAFAWFFISSSKIDFATAVISYPSDQEIAKNWPSFRGPEGAGVSPYSNMPTKWDAKSAEAIIWKSIVPLPGHNSPVIWNDRVFLSGANEKQQQVYCFSTVSGKLLWQADATPASLGGQTIEMDDWTGYAAPTVATDGARVCAIFPTGNVACFDFEGNKLWSRNLGLPDSMYGYASSLAVFQNLFLIQYDQATAEDNKSSLIALDAFSGLTVWETKRPVPNSWTSPIVVKIDEQYQLITCADPWVIAYDPANGTELWRVDCLGTDVAPSPIYAGGFVFGIHPYSKLIAIKPTDTGDVTKTNITWTAQDNIPDICSPVSNGRFIFLLESQGVLTCYKIADGTKLWQKDLKTNFTASPSLVGNNLYLLSEKGVMFIIEIANEYKELAQCRLDESCYSTPAFADGRIYIRTDKSFYCIGNKD